MGERQRSSGFDRFRNGDCHGAWGLDGYAGDIDRAVFAFRPRKNSESDGCLQIRDCI